MMMAGTAIAAAAAHAADIPSGRAKSAQCVACHGIAGIAPNPTFPHLAGQNAAYLQIQLERFRVGERYHALMTPIAESLSDEDIADLATFYSSIGPLSAATR